MIFVGGIVDERYLEKEFEMGGEMRSATILLLFYFVTLYTSEKNFNL